jgi:hypothetical protein
MELPKKTISKHRKNNEEYYENPGVDAAWDYIERKSIEKEAKIIIQRIKIDYFLLGFLSGILFNILLILFSILTK